MASELVCADGIPDGGQVTIDRRRGAIGGFCAAWLPLLLGCGESSTTLSPASPDTSVPATVLVSPATASLSALGDTVRFSAEVRDQRGRIMATAPVDWSTSDAMLATVDGNGLVTAVANGSATIMAVAGAASGTATATIRQLVVEVDVSPAADTLMAGDTLRLSAEARDANSHRVGTAVFVWHSTDVDVATVDQGGLVRALADGTARIPPELGNMPSLETFYAGQNKLSGRIPPELGNLPNLYTIAFDDNDLSGLIPGELSNLVTLTDELNLIGNRLSGPIPAELGDLENLRQLRLGSNLLSGPLPPELGGMRSLTQVDLSDNPALSGPLPASYANLRNLGNFNAAGTGLCIAPESPLAAPAIARRFRLPSCEPVAERSTAYLIQSIQSAAYPVPLVAGEDALLRVFVISAQETEAAIPPARATFFVGGAEVHTVDVPGQSEPIPTALAQAEASLDRSGNVKIPASVVRPGLEMVVEIDPAGILDADVPVAKRIPESGRMEVHVEQMPPLRLTFIPFLWDARPDSTAVRLVTEMVADPEGHRLMWDTRTLLPVGEMALTAHPPVFSSFNDGDALLDETSAIRALEGGRGYWMGALSGPATGPWGVAWIGGWTGYVRVGIVTEEEEALTIAHELGHNLDLWHAPCGTGTVLDQGYPYPGGATGSWGLDVRSGTDVLVPPSRKDLMSYCVPAWISEHNFFRSMNHRLKSEAVASERSAVPVPVLLVWGGTDGDGIPYLNPVFAADAPPTLPGPGGDHEVVGRAADGSALFSYSFAMKSVAHREGRSGFAYTIPSRPEWEGELVTVELLGPGGSATIDRNTDRPTTIVRERATGHVRAFLRDLPAAWAADGVAQPQPDVEILFSRGLPRPTAPSPGK